LNILCKMGLHKRRGFTNHKYGQYPGFIGEIVTRAIYGWRCQRCDKSKIEYMGVWNGSGFDEVK
jgi:hypothetical protein